MIIDFNLTILPPPQRLLWSELDTTPKHFALYGGTALALRLGHRTSIDFDFFSNQPFDPDELSTVIPYLKNAERVRVAPQTLTCRIERNGPVLVSFFGDLGLGQAAPCDLAHDNALHVASLLDLAGTKVAVVQKRAEAKDYLDIDALLQHGIELPTALAAGSVIYGRSFNPMITLKALCYFDDVPTVPLQARTRLISAVAAVNPAHIPALTPYRQRSDNSGDTP
jgi:hypothetical protein